MCYYIISKYIDKRDSILFDFEFKLCNKHFKNNLAHSNNVIISMLNYKGYVTIY